LVTEQQKSLPKLQPVYSCSVSDMLTRVNFRRPTLAMADPRYGGVLRPVARCAHRFPGLFTNTSEHIRFFTFQFFFSHFSVVGCAR